jgi:hypothetical protein
MTKRGEISSYASFRIVGTSLRAAKVSDLLGVEPTDCFEAGEVVMARGRVVGQRKQGLWSLSSRKAVRSSDLNRHLGWLLERLDLRGGWHRRLVALGADSFDVFCYWASERHGAGGGPRIEAEVMSRLGALGLPLDLDCYDLGIGEN